MKAKYLLKGIIRNIPGIKSIRNLPESTGGTCDARYCYSVWLRHLILAHENGFRSIPKALAEFGPGDSLGIGISALISGTEKYYALDVVKYSNVDVNIKIFDDLVNLFKEKTPVPDHKEFPQLKPFLKDYSFPKQIFPEDYLQKILNEDRLQKIRHSIKWMESSKNEDNIISYLVPWNKTSLIKPMSLDMIISQAVMQHVDDLAFAYKSMGMWLKPNGLISHQIDFRSLNVSKTWYGHWEYSDLEWKIIRMGKVYLINREQHSTHIELLNNNSFKVICDIKIYSNPPKNKSKIARRFRDAPAEDFSISGAFIQAIKK